MAVTPFPARANRYPIAEAGVSSWSPAGPFAGTHRAMPAAWRATGVPASSRRGGARMVLLLMAVPASHRRNSSSATRSRMVYTQAQPRDSAARSRSVIGSVDPEHRAGAHERPAREPAAGRAGRWRASSAHEPERGGRSSTGSLPWGRLVLDFDILVASILESDGGIQRWLQVGAAGRQDVQAA